MSLIIQKKIKQNECCSILTIFYLRNYDHNSFSLSFLLPKSKAHAFHMSPKELPNEKVYMVLKVKVSPAKWATKSTDAPAFKLIEMLNG